MKSLIYITVLLALAFSYRDLQADVYRPFDKNQLIEIRSNDRLKMKDQQTDPFKKAKRPPPINQQENIYPTNDLIPGKQRKHDREYRQKQRKAMQEYNRDFNEMLYCGLIFGSFFLVLVLIKTCIRSNRCQKRRRIQLRPQFQNCQRIMQPNYPQPNYRQQKPIIMTNHINTIDKTINYHKNQVQKLTQLKQKMRVYEEIPMKSEHQHIQFHEVDGIQYRNNIPVGRPINKKKDNDSSFASEYPVL